MKAVMISPRAKAIKDLLKKARRRDLILKSDEGEQFVLARITNAQSFIVGDSDDFATEVAATRRNKQLMKFLDERGARTKIKRGRSIAQVRERLGVKN
jgi:hypothetical protein